jgi:hypothetical protein
MFQGLPIRNRTRRNRHLLAMNPDPSTSRYWFQKLKMERNHDLASAENLNTGSATWHCPQKLLRADDDL